ncbi:YdiU family protein [Pseudodesulfovibrio sp. JC047]|uniref:protein adenylyltransferase SelO n=1 Tax=Pseudodesulfovibrio sp. JC047 TaxID=2683199 RepID=UPI0013D0B99E|nr:YdiU family protein [Pseudodesulfovibrio sp. JC047]NDV19678.1 YdiU family protein [Pseudodesulfovibrio sp. JC047]
MIFDNTYARLPSRFFQQISPVVVEKPSLIRINTPLAKELELPLPDNQIQLAELFAGNMLLDGMDPIAQAYAGHQFGHFVPKLGDGRAVLLGEILTSKDARFDIQLKGSGPTTFSRGGDGRSPLGPVIREYIVSEAMHALGIPTTRALAMVLTGEKVHRETELPGAILTRIARSFVRVGTFEFFAARQDVDGLKQLTDFVIQRLYPEALDTEIPAATLLALICDSQARLLAKWMSVGFIHGVMNTDNTALSGETIDYGPCAFMDHYDPAQVFSSIDHQGRYAYNQQPLIAQWNLGCLGGCLMPLFHADEDAATDIGETVLATFTPTFAHHYRTAMCAKIGLSKESDDGFAHVKRLLELMHQDHADFTETFRRLSGAVTETSSFAALFSTHPEIEHWLSDWHVLLGREPRSKESIIQSMRATNPAFIPRNHQVEKAIQAAETHGDFSKTHTLITLLDAPFSDQPKYAEYLLPPTPSEQVKQTFCGT